MPFDRGPGRRSLYKEGVDRLKPAVGIPSATHPPRSSASDALLQSLMASQGEPLGAPVGLHEDPVMVARDEEAAITWGKLYHTKAGSDIGAQKRFIADTYRHVLNADGSLRHDSAYMKKVTGVVEAALEVFTRRDGTLDGGVDKEVVRDLIYRIGAHESAGGTLKRNIAKKGQKASNASGIWQVMPDTVKGLTRSRSKKAYIGPKAMQFINESLQQTDVDKLSNVIEDVHESESILLSKKDISNLTTRQINELMVNNDAINAVFAIATLISQAKDKNELWRLRK